LVIGNEKDKILLSMKKLTENPFINFIKDKKSGDKIKVKIKEILNEGLLVELSPELDGFVHISELSYLQRIKNINDFYKAGDEIMVVIVKIDEQESKIYLSVKRAEKNPWTNMEERYPVNAWLVGTVKEIREGEGADIEIEENADAFVHISNISWFSFSKIADVLKVGDKREFRILGMDKAKYRILLGLKQMEASPWDSFMHKYKEGSFIDVKILEIDDSAILCQIVEGVNGRLPIKNRNKVPYKKGDII